MQIYLLESKSRFDDDWEFQIDDEAGAYLTLEGARRAAAKLTAESQDRADTHNAESEARYRETERQFTVKIENLLIDGKIKEAAKIIPQYPSYGTKWHARVYRVLEDAIEVHE